MFKLLKEKLKNWVNDVKEKVAPKEEVEETHKKTKKKEKNSKKKEKSIEKKIKPNKRVILEEPSLMPEEDGTSIEIEQEIEEGVSEEDIKQIENRVEEVEKTIETEKKSLFSKIKSKFSYKITEDNFNDLFDDLEMLLLENNVALEAVEDIKSKLFEKLIGKEILKEELAKEINKELKSSLNELLIEPDNPIDIIKIKKLSKEPFVILFFGINGTGKTTSIAKLTNLLKKNKFLVVLAAADTFRAASIEQISIHAEKLKVPLIKQDYGSDPASVGFDAIKYAKAHNIDVVLIDTAGRMHTKANLLSEMEKIIRVTKPDLKIFVAESIAGNDAIEQAKAFNEIIGIDGSILSKADIDEKGGTIISISHITHKPIFYLGTGQGYNDLEIFDKQKFIEKLGLG